MKILPVIDAQRRQLNSTLDEEAAVIELPEAAPLSGYSNVLTADMDYNDAILYRCMEFLLD